MTLCIAVQGCAGPWTAGVRPVPVEEVDPHGASLGRLQQLKRGASAASVVGILGEPVDQRAGCVPGEIIWRYPIRAWNDMATSRTIVPAAVLRISFDGSGTLTDWGFVDSSTGHALAVRETADDASRWFQSLSEAPPPIPARVDLDRTLIRGRTTSAEVERVLGRWQPDLHCGSGGPVPVVRKTKTGSGSTWDWYVDRASPLFIPPRYIVVSVDDKGVLIAWHLEQTYPGGRE